MYPIENLAVIGSGIMGTGIAQVTLLSGYQKVTLNDINIKILKKAQKSIESWISSLSIEANFKEFISNDLVMQNIMKNTSFGQIKSSYKSVGILAENFSVNEIMDRLVCETNLQKAISDADFIIEAVPEDLSLKKEIFKRLGKYSPPYAILASNTSTMSPSKLGLSSCRPEKVIGMHFHGSFPIKGRIIEITAGKKTIKDTMDIGCEVAERIPSISGERLILRLEKETPGFVVNRLTLARAIHLNWILDNAVEKGISLDQLVAGGLRLIGLDIVGLDTIYNTWKYLEENLSPDFAPGKVITRLVQNGELGKKTGKGFFEWKGDVPIIKETPVDAKTKEFLALNRNKNLSLAIRMNEACRLIEEGVIQGYETINQVDTIGENRQETFTLGLEKYKEWSEILETFADRFDKPYLKPCDLMRTGRFKDFH